MYISNHTTGTTMTSWSPFESNDICQVHLGEWNALRGNQSSLMLSISTLHKLLADQSLSCAESPKHVCTTLAIIGGQLGADPDWHVTSIHEILLLERLIVSFVLSSWNESPCILPIQYVLYDTRLGASSGRIHLQLYSNWKWRSLRKASTGAAGWL